jgi:hypothetical protein
MKKDMRSVSRTIRHRIALATVVGICSGGGLGEAQTPYRNAASICIDVTVMDDLTGLTFKAMRSEASRIWLAHGIILRWTSSSTGGCEIVVPLVFDETRLREALEGRSTQALAATEFSGRSRVIYVSARRAFEMLARIPEAHAGVISGGAREPRGGMLLGRVAAHEIGHVLLNSTAHANAGLMRPIFEQKDALSSALAATDLSRENETYLATRFSLLPAATPIEGRADLKVGPYMAPDP